MCFGHMGLEVLGSFSSGHDTKIGQHGGDVVTGVSLRLLSDRFLLHRLSVRLPRDWYWWLCFPEPSGRWSRPTSNCGMLGCCSSVHVHSVRIVPLCSLVRRRPGHIFMQHAVRITQRGSQLGPRTTHWTQISFRHVHTR